MTNEVIQNSTQKTKKRSKCMMVKGLSPKADRNILQQQSEYMKRTGKYIRKDYLAAMLLETATLPA